MGRGTRTGINIDVRIRRDVEVKFHCPFCNEEITGNEDMIASEGFAAIDMECPHCEKGIDTEPIEGGYYEEDAEFELISEEEDV